jgi:hypothetical protein
LRAGEIIPSVPTIDSMPFTGTVRVEAGVEYELKLHLQCLYVARYRVER